MSDNVVLLNPVSMRRYVFMSIISFVSLTLISFFVVFKTDSDPGNNFGSLLTLLSTIIGILAFYRIYKRPMFAIERLMFSVGSVVGQFSISTFFIALLLIANNLPLSFAGMGAFLGDNQGFLTPTVWISFTIFFSILVFVEAYFFCWLIGRRYKKKKSITA